MVLYHGRGRGCLCVWVDEGVCVQFFTCIELQGVCDKDILNS